MKRYIKKVWPLGLTNIILIVFMIVLNVITLTMLDNVAEQFFGSTPDYLVGSDKGQNVEYVKSSFDSVEDLYQYEMEKCAEIAQDGITLLKNDDDLLPLSTDTTLSLFSHSSVDLISGGSGSGSGSFELTADLKEGLENAGFKINETLWDFYKTGNGSGYKRGVGVINYGAALDWSINECPLSVITKDADLVASFQNTTAMFVLSRTGGEGGDEARDMKAYGGESGEHYLEPNKEELEIIDYLNKNFDNVILLVNCNNAMELGWVEKYPNIKSIINFPGAGRFGTYGLGYVLRGKDKDNNDISPSGHLVDTLVYDNFSSPAMQNMGDYNYANTKYYYVVYSEGIYVGYKYYETRYEDYVTGRENVGQYDYANTVTYPFGFGMSYTSFEWSNYEVSKPDKDGNMEVSIKVKNTGNYAGRDVVQIYYQSPYTQYDIENKVVIEYKDIPDFPVSTVEGHAGELIIGELSGRTVIAMNGRFHYYEGYDIKQTVFPIRVFALLGIEKVILTNAAGGINTDIKEGSFMVINDHLSFFAESVLRGKNEDEFGVRFPDMSEVYDKQEREKIKAIIEKHTGNSLEGVYAYMKGPAYETPAEIRALRVLGADAVGMSTVPEAVVARHSGMKVVAVSCITNMAAGVTNKKLSHEEVKETADRVKGQFKEIIKEYLK